MIKKIISIIKNRVPFLRSKQSLRVIPWFKDNGDKTHRMNYDLNSESNVFDLGGYEGQWASDIFSKYCCNLFIFEPYQAFFQQIEIRFLRNDKIKVFAFGLSDSTKEEYLGISDNGSSIFKQGNIEGKARINLVKAVDFMKDNNINNIDLMKINIEGGEYDLLEHLISSSYVTKIENIQIQFHDFVPNAELRMKSIQNDLSKTHYLTYQYEFVWENWRLKSK